MGRGGGMNILMVNATWVVEMNILMVSATSGQSGGVVGVGGKDEHFDGSVYLGQRKSLRRARMLKNTIQPV